MRMFVATMMLALIGGGAASGQDVGASSRLELDTRPTKVTAYRGRAWVERSVSRTLEPGLYKLVFSNLPPRWQPDSIQARVSDSATVLGIDTMSRRVTMPPSNMKELVEVVEAARRSVQAAKDGLAVTDASIAYVQTMMSKAAVGEQQHAGTTSLDVDSIERQMDYFSEKMRTLLDSRLGGSEKLVSATRALEVAESDLKQAGGASRTERSAVVEISVHAAGEIDATLGYLVTKANWEPRYDIRGDLDGRSLSLEYGAEIMQQSGEDWTDVTLVLSTAQPSQSANPPTIYPVYVDVYVPREAQVDSMIGGGGGRGSRSKAAPPRSAGMDLESYGRGAEVRSGGTSVTFTLPRRMTVETDSDSGRRTRIAEFEADVDFTFVAVPAMTEQVYLRGRFANASEYQLLPGRAGIFMGGDYVGPTQLGGTAPGAKMELFFGADPSLEATRTMLTKSTGTTGVFGGWTTTSYRYVVKIDNASSRPVKMELWDRRPVSRSEEIEVSVLDPSMPLSTDAAYVSEGLSQGLLRWDLTVPANRTGDDAFTVTYDLEIERKDGVEMTPIPE